MAVDILMIVAPGQLPELAVKAMAAEVVVAGGANAVTAPVPIGQDQPVQLRAVGINAAALAHGHMVRRIKAGRADVAPCAGIPGFPVYGIAASQRVAVILHQPEPVPVAESPHGGQIKGIAQRVGDHDRLRPLGQGFLQPGNVDIVLRHRHIHKNRNRAILKNGRYRGGKAAGNGDNLVSPANLPLAQFRRGQRRKGDQIGGRAAVDQMRVFHAQPCGEFFLEPLRKPPGRQPEIQHGIRQGAHFLFIKYARRVMDALPFTVRFLFFLEIVIIFRHKSIQLFPRLLLAAPSAHLVFSTLSLHQPKKA